MAEQPTTRIQWNAPDAVEQATAALQAGAPVELTLPADFHYAIFSHLHPHAESGGPEHIDERGGAELLRRAAEVRRLQGLERLAAVVEAAHARVRLQSPAPRFLILPEEE